MEAEIQQGGMGVNIKCANANLFVISVIVTTVVCNCHNGLYVTMGGDSHRQGYHKTHLELYMYHLEI